MKAILTPRVGPKWRDQARAAIHELEDGHRVIIRPEGVPITVRGCPPPEDLDLVILRFDFAQRDDIVVAKFQRIFAVNLLQALRDEPRGIVVGYGGTGVQATYRSCALQAELHARFPKATAPAGHSYHNRGLSADCPPTPDGRKAMKAHGFFDGTSFDDPSHFTFGTVG
jgi:hypothetical protein